jgi:hypothetical protein
VTQDGWRGMGSSGGSMIGNDMRLDSGVGVCGKEGQSVPGLKKNPRRRGFLFERSGVQKV